MTFIARGEVYDQQPLGNECDLDALIIGVALPNMLVDTIAALCSLLTVRVPRAEIVRAVLPAAAGLGGAGSLAPVSTTPGAPNETRNP